MDFAYGCFTLSAVTFQSSSAILYALLQVLNPRCKHLVWPLSRSLAATWKIDVSFSSYGYLDVSVPRVTFVMTMYSSCDDCTLLQPDSSIRTSAGQRIFAPYRSLSQLVTSFFGSQCQGIRLVLFFAWSASAMHALCMVFPLSLRTLN